MRALAAALTVAAVLLGGCGTGSYQDYQADAARTAEETVSYAQTALLAARAASRGDATGPFTEVLIAAAEEDAGTTRTSFEAEQPPNDRSDALRSTLIPLLDKAAGVLTQLRIATKRGRTSDLGRIAEPLDEVSKQLTELAGANR